MGSLPRTVNACQFAILRSKSCVCLCYNSCVGTLYLVATPIGNLEDISLRALRILGEVTLIAAEDTRRTGKLLAHYQIKTPLISYFEHNKLARGTKILEALEENEVALVSDAGTPSLSDPGYELVQEAIAAGHRVSPIPGASALLSALVASGLPTNTFLFLGYIPRKENARKKMLEELIDEPRTFIFFEVPHRLQESLAALEDVFGAERPIAIGREMTKMHEEILRGSIAEMRTHFKKNAARGELTLVIGGQLDPLSWSAEEVRIEVSNRLRSGLRPSKVASEVAAESGWLRREVYKITQEAK